MAAGQARRTDRLLEGAAASLAVWLAGTVGGAGPGPPAPADAPPAPTPRDVVVRGNNRFALDLYRALAEADDGNVLCSPLGLSTVLAITYAGAAGETAEQMAATLHFDLPPGQLHPAFAGLGEELAASPEPDRADGLVVANRLWGRRGETFRRPFLDTARAHYGGGFEAVDFRGAPDEARRTINAWIERRTGERITGLLQSSDLSSATVLVLTNAIHFKGTWLTRFDERHTRDGAFFVAPARPVRAPLMELTAELPVYESPELQAVELPYDGTDLAMVVLVPRRGDGLPALERSLTAGRLHAVVGGLRARPVALVLPRFRIERRVYLQETLARMGMPLAFRPGRADLSGICGAPGETWIDLVVHRALVEVDERGTEAAAAGGVVVTRGEGGPTVEVRADRPFLFVIRHRPTGGLVLLGRLRHPGPEGP